MWTRNAPLIIFRLDPALIRPGRVDMKEKIDYATDRQLQAMFLRFYPEQNEEMAALFSKTAMASNTNISLAQVQGLFLMYKSEPEMVLKSVDMLKQTWLYWLLDTCQIMDIL
mgnify:CR=1 FL=1